MELVGVFSLGDSYIGLNDAVAHAGGSRYMDIYQF